jgi:RND family efflux transporter MFP subunit
MSKKAIVTVIFIAVAVVVGIKAKALLKSRQEAIANEATPTKTKLSIPVVYATKGELRDSINMLAQYKAISTIKLSTKLAGYIKKIYVNESQSVKKGTLLVSIDDSEIQASIASLQTQLQAQMDDKLLSQKIYERNKKLYKIGGLSKEQLETSQIALQMKESILQSTKSKINQLQNQLRYMQIKAPFDGKIDKILLHSGDLAMANKPIISMSSNDKEMLVSFATSTLKDIKVSQRAYLDNQEIGYIKSIYPSATNSLATAKIALNTALNIPLNSNINVDIAIKQDRGCILPSSALWQKSDGEYILTYKDNRFNPIKVEPSIITDNKVLIHNCLNTPIANVSQAKYARLLAQQNIELIGADNGK